MTASQILDYAAIYGCEVTLTGNQPTVSGSPNAALLALLKQNRAEIISLLGGVATVDSKPAASEPEYCEPCAAWVFEAVDSANFCQMRRCQFRQRCREEAGPF